MEVKSTQKNHANATATAKIKSDELNKKVENLAQKAAKNAKIDGFRKGKVPVAAVKKRYQKELENDARSEFFREMVDTALKDLGRTAGEIIGEPVVSKFDENGGDIDVEIAISFRPVVSVDGFEEILPKFDAPKAENSEVEARISEILDAIAPVEKIDKKTLEKGDFAQFDFEGFVDGESFEGGKAEKYLLEIGSNRFIPGFEDGMIGLNVGEEKEIKVTFPKDYGAKNLAEKEAIFKVKLHEIRAKKVGELDEEAIKKILPNEEGATKETLENRIKSEIKAQKLQKLINDELKQKFAEAAVEKFNFDLPNNIIEQEIDMQFRNAWGGFSEDERKKLAQNRDEAMKKREEFREDATKSVRLTFIVDELARVKNISVSDNELIQTIYFEAYRLGQDPKKHLENYKNQGILPAIKMAMIEDKLFNNLFAISDDEAQKAEKKTAPKNSAEKIEKTEKTEKESEKKAKKETAEKDAEKKPKSKKAKESE